AVEVEWVAEQRAAEFLGGAGELAEDEHTARVDGGLDGHEFLCDEVHPVAQRRDETDVGESVVGEEAVRCDAAEEVVDGDVGAGIGEATVDAANEFLDLGAQLAVLAYFPAAWDCDLDEREPAPQLWARLE